MAGPRLGDALQRALVVRRRWDLRAFADLELPADLEELRWTTGTGP